VTDFPRSARFKSVLSQSLVILGPRDRHGPNDLMSPEVVPAVSGVPHFWPMLPEVGIFH
jgi:hypothetical protein